MDILEEVIETATLFRQWYRDLAMDGDHSSPRNTFPRRVQVEHMQPNAEVEPMQPNVVDEITRCLNDIGEEGPATLVNQTLENTKVAGGAMVKRRVLATDQNVQHPEETRRFCFRHSLNYIRNACQTMICRTMRDLFYSNPTVFTSQALSNRSVNDVCVRIGCDRNSTSLFAEDRGYVIGGLTFTIRHDREVNCNSEGIHVKCKVGHQIPPFLDSVDNIVGDQNLLFILYIEKYSAFSNLAQLNFHNTYHCLLITGKGCADVATRLFLNTVARVLDLPVFCLVDSDLAGIEIYTQLKYGTTSMAYNSRDLTCSRMYYLGVSVRDLDHFSIPSQPITEKELGRINQLRKEDWVRQDRRLRNELYAVRQRQIKAPIESLNNIRDQFLGDNYLPIKLVTVMRKEMMVGGGGAAV